MKTLAEFFKVCISLLLTLIGLGVVVVGFFMLFGDPMSGLYMMGGGVVCIIVAVATVLVGDD